MDYDALSSLVFYIFAAMAVICALCVVASRNPVTSAMCMALSFLATAGVLFGMGAQFLGIVQLIVYAGAILVLFLFVIMMLDVKAEEGKLTSFPRALLGVIVASVFCGMIAHVAIDLPGAKDGSCPFKALFCGNCSAEDEATAEPAAAGSRTAQAEARQAAPVVQPAPVVEYPYGGPLPKLDAAQCARELDPSISAQDAKAATSIPDAKLLGKTLYTEYSLPFALLAFALLGGTVGAIALGRRIRKD